MQYFVISYKGKESEKNVYIYIYICIELNHFAVHLKLIHLNKKKMFESVCVGGWCPDRYF